MSGILSTTVAGIVIRSNDLELLALQGKKAIAQVRVPIAGTEVQHLAQAIQQALAAAGLKTRKLAVSIPSQEVLLRFFTIPLVPKPEWDSAVQFEARKYIPFKPDQLIWDYHILPSPGLDRLEVIFAAISRDLFQTIREACAAAGVQPVLIEPRGLSLARLLEPAKGKASQEFTCIVDIEEDAGHLAIVKNRVPYLTRNVNLVPRRGPASTPEPQAPELPDAGRPLREEPGGPPLLQEGASVDPRAQRLLSELSVSMDFFMREYPSTTIPRVVLCGEEGLIGPWCQWLAEALHCEVELGSGLMGRYVQGELPLSFASAVGLLHAKRDSRGASLDFLKRSLVKAAPSRPRGAPQALTPSGLLEAAKSPQGMMSAVAALLVAVAAWAAGDSMVRAERSRLAQAVGARPEVAWGLERQSQQELESLKSSATSQLAVLKPLVEQRVRVAAKLDALARALPDGVWMTALIYEDPLEESGKSQPRIALNGACFLGNPADELSAIQRFEEQVKRSPVFFSGFGAAQLGRVQANAQDQYTYRTFEFNCSPDRRL